MMWKLNEIHVSVSINKDLLVRDHIYPMMLSPHLWLLETMRPAKPKLFTIELFTGKICQLCF